MSESPKLSASTHRWGASFAGRCALILMFAFLAACGDPEDPTLLSLMPPSGPSEGGTTVVLRGSDFEDESDVLFDDVPATDVQVHSDELITAVAPAHAAGTVTVAVVGPSGGRGELLDAYEYRLGSADGSPRLLGAVSVSNTTVRLSFSEPLAPEPVADGSSYEVVAVDGVGRLHVLSGARTRRRSAKRS